jgi:methyl-accepting chemotaxis protein
MKWFMNLSLRNKIGTVLGFISFFMLAMVIYSYLYLSTLKEQQAEINGKYINLRLELDKIRGDIDNFKIHIFEAFASGKTQLSDSIDTYLTSLEIAKRSSLKNIDEFNPEQRYSFDGLREVFENYVKHSESHLKEAKDKNPDIRHIIAEQNLYSAAVYNSMLSYTMQIQKDLNEIAQSAKEKTFKIIVLILLAALIFFIATAVILVQANKLVADPLNKLASASQHIAQGDINVTITTIHRNDEIGRLNNAFQNMLGSLNEIGLVTETISNGDLTIQLRPKSEQDIIFHSLNKMTNNLRKIISESIESISAINQISGNTFSAAARLATSSNQTATAIGETTVTIEEVKRTSEILSKKAKEISVIAQKAADISEVGLQATEDTTQGIKNIGEQMTTIGESALRLSELSRTIGNIIASVSDIAEQSNLLAVNAAIEAARAGEHGKSFVIVAQEIKTLAQQSKQATIQVKTALNDIQNAISATVMATEQGEKIVNTGVRLSQQTRNSIHQLAETITVFTDISMQTSASSQEQFVGMDQVAIAMDNIKVASAQNALTTKELEQLAGNLQGIAAKLNDIRTVFKV